ncbi:MAG: hypothetical protein N2485_08620, partial [bacterium]|nr:hypothetical protein [bacterium]
MANQSQNQENQNQQGQIGQQLQSRLSNLNPEQRTILNWCVQAWNQSNPNAAFSNIASTILHDQIDMNNSCL